MTFKLFETFILENDGRLLKDILEHGEANMDVRKISEIIFEKMMKERQAVLDIILNACTEISQSPNKKTQKFSIISNLILQKINSGELVQILWTNYENLSDKSIEPSF